MEGETGYSEVVAGLLSRSPTGEGQRESCYRLIIFYTLGVGVDFNN